MDYGLWSGNCVLNYSFCYGLFPPSPHPSYPPAGGRWVKQGFTPLRHCFGARAQTKGLIRKSYYIRFSLKTIPLKQLVYLPILIFLLACSSAKKIAASKEEPQTLPELPLSELDIPIKIAAAPIMAKAEKLVPAEFTSDGWPDFLHPSCDFRYKYRFIRTGLQVNCINNVISIKFGGNYQVGGSKCLCTAGIPVTPWISGSCGFPPQPLRKVNMASYHQPAISSGLPDTYIRQSSTGSTC